MQTSPGDVVVAVMMTLFGFLGLFLASRAQDDAIYVFSLSLAGFAVIFVLGVVKRYYDVQDAATSAAREQVPVHV